MPGLGFKQKSTGVKKHSGAVLVTRETFFMHSSCARGNFLVTSSRGRCSLFLLARGCELVHTIVHTHNADDKVL